MGLFTHENLLIVNGIDFAQVLFIYYSYEAEQLAVCIISKMVSVSSTIYLKQFSLFSLYQSD